MTTDERTELQAITTRGGTGAQRTDADLGADAVALTVELVGIDSVNPGLVAGAAGEAAVVDHLLQRLRLTGFETHVVTPPGRPDRPSLVAVGPGDLTGSTSGTRPTVVLTGHLDTVGVEGMADSFAATVDGDRLSGRGTSDMKGGVAAMVVAAEELVRRGSPARVVLALVADEEDASLGAEAVLDALPELGIHPDVAVVGEPTWLAQAATLRGYAVIEVTFTGRPAHSSQPELGVNAVTHLGRLLVAVEERGRRLALDGGSLLVTVASGGQSPFVLAGTARAVVERRTVPGERAADALAEVEALLDGLRAMDPTVDAAARLVIAREAWQLDDTGPAAILADELEGALAEPALTEDPLTGTALAEDSLEEDPLTGAGPAETALAEDSLPGPARTERFHAPFWMEAPLWQAAGIPAVVCGPAGGGLHATDEWVSVSQVQRYALALVTAVTSWAERAD